MFPPEVTLKRNGLEVKLPGFFSGKSTFIPYSGIMDFKIDSP